MYRTGMTYLTTTVWCS